MTVLLDNVDIDTVSTEEFVGSGGPAIVFIRADGYGGGTVTLSTAPPSDTFKRFSPMNNGEFTGDGEVQIDYLPADTRLIAELSGSTGASNVFVEAV